MIDLKTLINLGRVSSRRNQGSKLSFIDVESGGDSLQAVLKVSSIAKFKDGALSWDLREDRRHIQRGDWIGMKNQMLEVAMNA